MRREITARDDRRLFAAGARSPVASTASSGLVHTARFSLLRTLLVPLMCCSAARAMSQPGGRGLPRVSSWAPPASISAACFRDTFAGGATKGRWEVAHGGVSRSQQFRRGEAVGRSTRGGVAAAARGVWMKANKKNKRKREQRQVGGGGEEASAAASSTPQRVSTNAPISVRAQIKYAKIRKSRQKAHPSGTKKVTNAYRRVKNLDYDHDIVEPEDLSKVYMPEIAPSLMVDGYNIIFHWSKCCIVAEKGDLETARRILLDELDTLSAMRGWDVTVVFDAYKRKGGNRRGYTTANKIEVVFTSNGESADMYVERETMLLKDAGCPNVMVATGDKLMQSLVVGAGAEVFSPDRIVEEIEVCHREAASYTDWYIRRKEKQTAASDMEDLLSSVRYVENKSKQKRKGNSGGRGGRGGGRTFNIEDDL